MKRRDMLTGLAASGLLIGRARGRSRRSDRAQAVESWANENNFSGIIASARKGAVDAVHCFGMASLEGRIPVTATTKYAIGSISKWFTTAAVLRLCDQGRLRLDASVGTYLPALTGPAAREVRLEDLLCNSSGIPDRLIEAARTDPALRSSGASAIEMVRRFVPGDLAFRPRTKFDYSVLNWVIVRAILEQVTAKSFVPLMQELVLAPAGVSGVGIAEKGFANAPGLAPAYGGTMPPARKLGSTPGFAAASGTFYADAGEMLMAAHRIFGGALLSPASRRTMLAVRMPEEEYALGGRAHAVDGRIWAWETGKIGGYRSHLAHDAVRDRTIVLLGNTDMSQTLIAQIVERLARMA